MNWLFYKQEKGVSNMGRKMRLSDSEYLRIIGNILRKKELFNMNYKSLRKLKGLSQTQMAKEIGVSTSAWESWEHGLKQPNKDNMQKIKEVFSKELAVLQAIERGD